MDHYSWAEEKDQPFDALCIRIPHATTYESPVIIQKLNTVSHNGQSKNIIVTPAEGSFIHLVQNTPIQPPLSPNLTSSSSPEKAQRVHWRIPSSSSYRQQHPRSRSIQVFFSNASYYYYYYYHLDIIPE